ncbi:MAG: alpha-amylase, partial [Candidatus Heimdallarchaeota archaeon]|nr:alpha-amylase [Candidatus Heimdallarchaeota archaeon]
LQNSISYETEIPIYKPSTQFQPKSVINNEISIGEGVMLQGYYWLSPEGDWWNTVSNYIPEFAEVGFDAIWLPPVSKGASFTGISSMGYEPYDYYDLGEFNQRGGVRTRFGTVEELDSLITNAHANGIALIADLVLNHNNGGDSEYNPNTFTNTLTDFSGVASGIFPRNYSCFHPCDFAVDDEGSFAIFPDLCHDNPYVQSEFIKWGKWLMNEVGFDGWRFDYVKGFSPTVVENWMVEVGQWGVAEFWDGNKELVKDYMVSTGNTVNAFDFPLLYRLHDMCDSHGLFDLGRLAYDNGLLGDIPEKSVTFVSNHDTTRDENSNIEYNKHLAYAYILTHQGYPSVFWRDYFNLYYHDHIQALVQIHNNYAKGETEN